ncbi:hypothetical protein ACE7GA_11540 [Roseomonas sp. CCTCC AB2023176]|uniref:hypothetical protein n=1 Tax=Roseomonas sp. CCTCC AB2023176 TaxID=3342640 RepID=UPI0035DB40BB
MILQLDPPLPMDTVRGAGLAHFLIDYGPETHLMWVVFLDADGACWTVPNPEVRMQPNWSLQRRPGRARMEGSGIVAPPGNPAAPILRGPTEGEMLNGADANAPFERGAPLNGAVVNGVTPGGARPEAPGAIRYDAAPAA